MSNHKAKRGIIRPDRTVEVTSFEGIMPDPDTLAKLELIIPGLEPYCWILTAYGVESPVRVTVPDKPDVSEIFFTWEAKHIGV